MRTKSRVMGKYVGGRDASGCDAGRSSIVRNRYFFSMLLEPQDMAEEQAYHRGNIQRHTAGLHGFGTVCGLRVERTECHEQVVIKAGVAMDCLGREIRIEKDVTLELHDAVARVVRQRADRPPRRDEPDDHGHSRDDRGYDDRRADHDRHDDDDDDDDDDRRARRRDDDDCPDPVDVFVSLCYREHEERPVQAIGGPETCCGATCQNSRIRSGWRLEVTDEPPKVPRRVRHLMDDLFKCERERLSAWICEWITDPCWQCEPDPCDPDHVCVGLARVRVVPGGSVVDIDNCAIRPLVLPTVLLSALSQYAVERSGRE